MTYNQLTTEEENIILHKGTEAPFHNEYDQQFAPGAYICKQCNQPLYDAKTKFDAGCGWPAFDSHIPGSVEKHLDADGIREEIVCSNCKGHLGHVFVGEHLTNTNTRHCVNSVSVKFIPEGKPLPDILHT